MWLGESRVQPVTPPCEGGSVFDLDSSRGPTSRLSRGEVEQLMQLAGPADLDVPSDHDSMLSSLQRSLEDDHRHVRRGGHTRDQDDDQEEESAFDGVTERQLEQMRLLQVCRTCPLLCFTAMYTHAHIFLYVMVVRGSKSTANVVRLLLSFAT